MAPDRGDLHVRDAYADMEISLADEPLPSQLVEEGTSQLEQHPSYNEAQRMLATRGSKPQNFTLRGVLLGLAIGIVICFSNTYFGLQTGWVSGMSMPSALIGFAFFKSVSSHIKLPFSPVENVLVQTVASSMGTMPLGCGFVGVVPALEYLLTTAENGPLNLGLGKLCLWAVGICLFGVVFAVPLRREVIIREKLKFPSGTATALMIGVLHGEKEDATILQQETARKHTSQEEEQQVSGGASQRGSPEQEMTVTASETELLDSNPNPARGVSGDWKAKIRLLTIAFAGSAFYTIFSYFIPQVRHIPILGLSLARNWLWMLNPSPAYVGQGIIMGPATTLHMLLGAVVGWGILSPLAKRKGWAPGLVSDWNEGSKGWIVWISLAIMLADSIVSLAWLAARPLIYYTRVYGPEALKLVKKGDWQELRNRMLPSPRARGYSALNTNGDQAGRNSSHQLDASATRDVKNDLQDDPEEADAPPEHLVSPRSLLLWLFISLALYFASVHLAFPSIIPISATILALLLSLLLSVMGVRALGETDLNPVSGISKLTQLFFAFVIPRDNPNVVIINLLAGAISESGALQAGDLLQDLKTGHLLGAAPNAQFYGQIIGSVVGAVVSAAVYKLYTAVYTIPSPQFQVPTSYVWVFTARLVTGKGLPAMAGQFAFVAAAIFAVLTAVRTMGQGKKWHAYVPGGIAVAVGMYNVPSFTLARAAGGLISWYWTKWTGKEETTVVVLASGLILGEGLCSILNLVMASIGMPHL